MQMNRLFEIVYMLLSRQMVTAKELAEHFEVSTRTIYRDIEALSGAGIPVYMCQGKGGGIRLLDNFILNKTILSEQEQQEILSALQGIGATTGEDSGNLMSKLSGMFHRENENWIEVDFSDWSGIEQEKFNLIKQGILTRRIIQFDYFGRNGEKIKRTVKPVKLYFRDKTWYLNGYCMTRQAMRLFKLRRMKQVEVTEEEFERMEDSMEEVPVSTTAVPMEAGTTRILLEIDRCQAYRVYDEFQEQEIIHKDDDKFLVEINFHEDEWVYGMILSFGSYAKVIEPPRVRKKIEQELKKAWEHYQS